MSRIPRAAVSLAALLSDMADEIDAGLQALPEDAEPLWEPMPPTPGRGLKLADGRIVSPQRAAYESLADELFYGGSAGGGKTEILLGLAITKHRRSIIFRRQFRQHRGVEGAWERSKEIIGLRGDPNEGSLVWRNLPGGRAIEFGACDAPDDWIKYKGRPHDFKGFDEITELLELQYRALIGWLRTTRPGQRCRVVVTGNPPTSSDGQWVIKYWGPWLDPTHPHPAQDGELRWYATVGGVDAERPDGTPFDMTEDDGKVTRVTPRSRTFIGARVEDNLHYMRTGYDQVLNALPEPLRSQMRFGDFTKTASDDDYQVIPTAWIVAAQARWTKSGGDACPVTSAGCDPSRGGTDEFVVAEMRGPWVAPLHLHKASEALDGGMGAALIFRDLRGDTAVPVQVDIIGTAGASVYDHALGLKLTALPVNGSERSLAKDASGRLGFANVRAELHWKMRELLDPASGNDVALPPDPQLRSDLAAPRWRPTPQGIRVELKEDIKARLGRSPDRGEAVMYAAVAVTQPPKKKTYTSATWR